MWSLEQLEDICEDCITDIITVYPELDEKIIKSRIEINHKTSSTLARYSLSRIEISAYLLAGSTQKIFFQTLIMKGLIRAQVMKLNPNLIEEEIVWSLDERFPGKYDFEEYKDFKKQNIKIPQKNGQEYKYAVHCPSCGELFKYKRICKTVLNPEDYLCLKCNVPLERL